MEADYKEEPHVLIVEAPFYEDIAAMLAKGAIDVLEEAGASYDRMSVPGALEIPAAIQYAIKSLEFYTSRRRYDAFVALGCVIRGETSHYDIVAAEIARGLMDLSVRHTLAIGNGVITTEDKDQAIMRADPKQKNKGGLAAKAALDMLNIKSQFGIFPR